MMLLEAMKGVLLAELNHWTRSIGTPADRDYMLRQLDWQHFAYPIGFIAKNIGVYRPGDRALELGCGPCGLLPWIKGLSLVVGLDPLADRYRYFGIQYALLGYQRVVNCGIEEAADKVPFSLRIFDLLLCFNVLDHIPVPLGAVNAIAPMGHAGTDMYLGYDVRKKGTVMHPGVIDQKAMREVLGCAGWTLKCEQMEPYTIPAWIVEADGRSHEWWVKG